MTSSAPPSRPADHDALRAALACLRRPLARFWLYGLWYFLGCLGVACFWASRQARPAAALATGLAYLLGCGAALFVPGVLIGAGSVAARLTPRRHRALLDGYFIAAAGLAVATILSGHLTATPLLILLVGNAILALDAQERATRYSCGTASTPHGTSI